MVMNSTSTLDVSIHAVSPESMPSPCAHARRGVSMTTAATMKAIFDRWWFMELILLVPVPAA